MIEEEENPNGGSDEELDTSKISLFTADENQLMMSQNNHQPQYIIEHLDQNMMTMETV